MALKVLYVDDDADIRDVVELSLGLDPDIEVRLAASGAEALEMLAQPGLTPDLLLLDVMMPGLDGPGVLAALQARPQGAPRTVFCTARALPDEIAKLRALGAAEVITKPFDPLALAGDVRRLAS